MLKLRKPSLSPFLQKASIVTLASILNAGCQIITIKAVAFYLGSQGLGIYLLLRRFIMLADPITLLNLQYALPKRIAENNSIQNQKNYLLSGAGAALVIPSLILLFGIINRDSLSELIFKDKNYSSEVIIFCLLLITNSNYGILYGYYRGKADISKLALLQLFFMAFGPLIISLTIASHYGLLSFLWALVCLNSLTLIPLIHELLPHISEIKKLNYMWRLFKSMGEYAIPRIPATFFIAGIGGITCLWATAKLELELAGFLATGLAFISLVDVALSGVVTVLLPTAAFQKNNIEQIRRSTNLLVQFGFGFGVFCGWSVWLWADVIIQVWLGPGFQEVISIAKILSVSIPLYMLYLSLVGFIEGFESRPVVTVIHGVGFLLMLIGLTYQFSTLTNLRYLAWSCAAGFSGLGIAVVLYLLSKKLIRVSLLRLAIILFANIACFFFSSGLRGFLIIQNEVVFNILYAMLIQSLVLIVYSFFLWLTKDPVLRALIERISIHKN